MKAISHLQSWRCGWILARWDYLPLLYDGSVDNGKYANNYYECHKQLSLLVSIGRAAQGHGFDLQGKCIPWRHCKSSWIKASAMWEDVMEIVILTADSARNGEITYSWDHVSVWNSCVILYTPYHLLWMFRWESDFTWCRIDDRELIWLRDAVLAHTSLCGGSMRWDRFRQLILTLPRQWKRFTMTAADNKL